MEKRLHVVVSGIVQGVLFRATTRQWATALGLKGFVRNLPDGKVEVVAEGNEETLEKLLAKLNEGPPAAEVENIEVSWEKPKNEFSSFEIRF